MGNYKRIIFIHRPPTKIGGIPIIDERNREVLSRFADEVSVFAIDRFQVLGKSRWTKYKLFLRILLGGKAPAWPIEKLIGKIDDGTLVFISHSTCGLISAMIKASNPSVKVITFFHNVEADYFLEVFKHTFTWGALRSYVISLWTERLSLKNTDKAVVLNLRDRDLLARRYGWNDAFLLPTSLPDRFNPARKKVFMPGERLSLLFVGTYFMSNREGVEWMVKNLAPFVDADFYIVGAGMERLRPLPAVCKNVFISGRVSAEELDGFYYGADVFISTLFAGGGMKTKVAEAMMFALPVIGTAETYQGYDGIEGRVGIKSDCAAEIIAFINRLKEEPELLRGCSECGREIFLRDYSYDSSVDRMREILASERPRPDR